jgi:hypothetical protein
MTFSDPLLARAQVLVMENRLLQQERRQMRAEREHARKMLKINLFEAASLRAETVSVRQELSYRRLNRPRHFSGGSRLDS